MANDLVTADAASQLQTYVFSTAQAFEAAQRMATALSKASMVPPQYQNSVPNCLIALEISHRQQSSVLMVMQNLYMVHNRPSWSSQYIIAGINTCGRFKPLRFDRTGAENTDNRQCIAWTVGREVEIPNDIMTLEQAKARNLPVLESPAVSIKMAKDEGWYQKNGSKWQTMPELMLCYRSATFFGRLYAPEILMGMKTQDEILDLGKDEYEDITPKAPSIIDNINEAIKAEKIVTPITDIVADQNKAAATAVIESAESAYAQPKKIPAKASSADATQTDWESWATEWARYVLDMTDAQSLTKLRKLNETILSNMEKVNPPKFAWCMEQLTMRTVALNGIEN